MRWFGAWIVRVFLFWGAWVGLSGLALDFVYVNRLSGAAESQLVRITLFLATAILLAVECFVLDGALSAYERAMRDEGITVPPRLEAWLQSGWVRWPVMIGCYLILRIFGIWSDVFAIPPEPGDTLLRVATVLALSWAGLSWMRLVLGGFSWIHHRWRGRRIQPEHKPARRTLLPWSVAAWAGLCLSLSLLGAPERATVEAFSVIGGRGLEAIVLSAVQPASEPLEVLVELGPDDSIGELSPLLDAYGAVVEHSFTGPHVGDALRRTWTVRMRDEHRTLLLWALLLDRENVTHLTPNVSVAAADVVEGGPCRRGATRLVVDDPWAAAQPELDEMGANRAFGILARRYPRRQAVVALIDTPVAPHDGLPVTTFADEGPPGDHGTATAALIGASTNNGMGTASLNVQGRFVRVLSIPVFDHYASPHVDDIAAAVLTAIDQKASVINLSFTSLGEAPFVVKAAILEAQRNNMIVVAAAGNTPGLDAAFVWPANIDGVLAVGATHGMGGASASSTTRGVNRSVSAPGVDVCVPDTAGGYRRMTGTSMAAAEVSGLIATIRSVCPRLDSSAVLRHVTTTAVALPGSGMGPKVRADEALLSALGDPSCDSL